MYVLCFILPRHYSASLGSRRVTLGPSYQFRYPGHADTYAVSQHRSDGRHSTCGVRDAGQQNNSQPVDCRACTYMFRKVASAVDVFRLIRGAQDPHSPNSFQSALGPGVAFAFIPNYTQALRIRAASSALSLQIHHRHHQPPLHTPRPEAQAPAPLAPCLPSRPVWSRSLR